ncbi:hypothetical protein [Rhodococcus tukisamuensis]|uniref:Uncharacterized protein n=1 Tax=Rhodococcus tukisamuensis TaxID=168276 RepID=A0A1G6UU15_9NOCA|nr:hypothetical protein [Rhodococcus tukisamuensis]SDD44055.1 hypothetical protein SAMN05444580_104279 [Rhodococcus tukisamuensis]
MSVKATGDAIQLDSTLSPLLERLPDYPHPHPHPHPTNDRSSSISRPTIKMLGMTLPELEGIHAGLTRLIAATSCVSCSGELLCCSAREHALATC